MVSGSRIAGGSEKRGGTPGRTEGAVGVAVVLMEVPVAESIRERGYTAGAAAALSPVACRRWLRLVDVADAAIPKDILERDRAGAERRLVGDAVVSDPVVRLARGSVERVGGEAIAARVEAIMTESQVAVEDRDRASVRRDRGSKH